MTFERQQRTDSSSELSLFPAIKRVHPGAFMLPPLRPRDGHGDKLYKEVDPRSGETKFHLLSRSPSAGHRLADIKYRERNAKILSRYGIEQNPGPHMPVICETTPYMESSGLYVWCSSCDNLTRAAGYMKAIYLTVSNCSECLEHLELQSGSHDYKLSPESDYVVKLIENVLTFVRLLSKANDKEDYALAIASFAQFRSNRSLTTQLMERWGELMDFTLQDGGLPTSFYAFKDLLSRYEMLKKLPIFTKLYRFLMYCIGTSVFEKMGIDFDHKRFIDIEKAAIEKQYHMGPDFIHCVLETIVFIVETGYQCMVTGSIDPILHHETSYEQWVQEGEKLRLQAKYISNPEPHGFTVYDFLARLDGSIDKGRVIIRFMGKNDPFSMIIRRLVSDLENVKADCKTKRLAQQERKAPFAVLVHGGSSVAKSQFTKVLYYHFGKMFKLPIDDEYKYTRNAFDQYWTNFNSSQWCLQLDDIAYLHPNKSSECDPSLVEMLQVVNNVPYVPTQADIADKGKTPVRARFVIATTNTESLNAEQYFACPLAVQRRLPWIISLKPKPEYMRDEGMMIDPTKIPVSKPVSTLIFGL